MLGNKKIRIILLASLLLLFLSPGLVLALEINYPRVPGATAPQDFVNTASPDQFLSLYVLYIFNLAIWISGAIALGVLTYAGFRYLTSAGKPEAMIAAKNQISSAFLGILLLLSSVIILNTINPQLTKFQMPKLAPPQVIQGLETPAMGAQPLVSSIDTELPFGRIIEDYVLASSTMSKIKANASTTLDIATKLKDQSEDLEEKTHMCHCGQAKPKCDQSCNTYCSDNCTCDVCDSVRDDIQDLEEKNLEEIDKLKEEQKKTTEEIRILREELTKLERFESFSTQDCRLWLIQSLREFLIKLDKFVTTGELTQINFWDKISTVYFSKKQQTQVRDWASFYCQVSGTTYAEQPSTPALEEPSPGIPEEYTTIIKSCPQEAPVGDIIERTKRTGYTLVEKLEQLNQKSKEMIDAISELHVAISGCSSQMPMCCSLCIKVYYVCIKLCVGMACPWSKIQDALERIQDTQAEIERLVSAGSEEQQNGENGGFGGGEFGGGGQGTQGPGPGGPGGIPGTGGGGQTTQDKGIIPIIDKVVPTILNDLENYVRLPMRECVIKGGDKVLADCQSIIGALDQKGEIIRTCCRNEPPFQECLDKCHLEEGQTKYKKCLTDCLNEKASETESPEIGWCRHQLNFFCCNVEKELLK